MMESKEVVITYETLFELLKRETDRVELQKLEPSFFADVVAYIREKQTLLQKAASQSYEEQMKVQRELGNIKKILRDLYDRREKKIVRMAIDESRTKSNLVDMSAMLREERDLFEHVKRSLDGFRSGLLVNMMEGKMPGVYAALQQGSAPQSLPKGGAGAKGQDQAALPASPSTESSKVSDQGVGNGLSQDEKDQEFRDNPAGSVSSPAGQDPAGQDSQHADTKLVRFLHAVPKFVGTELEEYGPFHEDDIASLPTEVVDVLLAKGRVEEIKEG